MAPQSQKYPLLSIASVGAQHKLSVPIFMNICGAPLDLLISANGIIMNSAVIVDKKLFLHSVTGNLVDRSFTVASLGLHH
jgi:hypothetical protein